MHTNIKYLRKGVVFATLKRFMVVSEKTSGNGFSNIDMLKWTKHDVGNYKCRQSSPPALAGPHLP